MIRSFADRNTERLFRRERVPRFAVFERSALVRLAALDAAASLYDLRAPGLRLEALRGDRKGQYSIRINDRWRIVFKWVAPDAVNVGIVDYH